MFFLEEVTYLKRQILIDFRGARNQAAMAKLYGVTQQAWARWEAGYNTPTPDKMKQLEDDIGVPMEVIFADAFYTDKT